MLLEFRFDNTWLEWIIFVEFSVKVIESVAAIITLEFDKQRNFQLFDYLCSVQT